LVFVPIMSAKHDPFVMAHAKQGLVILIGYALAFLAMIWLPSVGAVLFLVLILASVAGMIQALLGHRWRIPLIGQIAAKFTL